MPGCMKRQVAIKLITGHIRHTIMEEIAKVMKTGLSSGDTMRNASFRDSFSTAKYSRMQAMGHMMGISWNDNRKISLVIPPLSSAML